jgi:hypothetical protein
MSEETAFELAFLGRDAERQEIDFYDVAEALKGFQRSLALTVHLVLNGEVITQAPSLKGAQIFLLAPEGGSWKATAVVAAGLTGLYHLGTAPRDTPLGNLISSAYDYVISETLGFHVDYDKTLGQQYEELKRNPNVKQLPQAKFDAIVEKCETSVKTMHRPIVISETATKAEVRAKTEGLPRLIGHALDQETYAHLAFTARDDRPLEIVGRVSSYNANTFKGRIYVAADGRPIPFELAENARTKPNIALITESLRRNAADPRDPEAEIKCTVYRETGRSGRIKRVFILNVSK